MGKVEKHSPSPTYSKSGSKRSKMVIKAVRQTDEIATGQHASENTATKMDETVETDRDTSETVDNWQTVTNQRSNKLQKNNSHAPTTAMSFFGQAVPQNLKTDGVHSYFSFGGNDTRSKPIFRQTALQKSPPMQQPSASGASSTYVGGRRKKSNLPPFKLEFEAQQKPMEIQVLNDPSCPKRKNHRLKHVETSMNNATSCVKLIIDENRCFTQNIDDHPPVPKFINPGENLQISDS